MEQPAPALRSVHGQRAGSAVLHRGARPDARFESAVSQSRAPAFHRDQPGQVAGAPGRAAAGLAAGQFVAPHGIAVDSRGDIYVGEVSYTAWSAVFPEVPKPDRIRTLQKLVKIA